MAPCVRSFFFTTVNMLVRSRDKVLVEHLSSYVSMFEKIFVKFRNPVEIR
jgi:hypothetical protein